MTMTGEFEHVRKRIIQLAREIEEFSQSELPAKNFFDEFLNRVVQAVGARGGAVWMLNGDNRLNLISERGLNDIGFTQNPQAQLLNQRLLSEVMSNGQACSYSAEDAKDVQLPTQDLIILAALQRNKECVGVVEIFQRPDTPLQARAGFLQFIEQMSGYACRFLDRQTEANAADTSLQVSGKFEQFVLQLHKSLIIKEVAGTAGNDGRLLLDCDRLSVAVKHGKKYKIRAISGQDSVNQRSNLVRTMTAMASKAIAMGETLVYAGRVENLAPQIEIPLANYIQESGSRMVMVVPLLEPEPLIDEEDKHAPARRKEKHRKTIGGLIVEQVSESQPKAGLQDRVELMADHVAEALYNAQTYQGMFLQPVWRALGRVTGWFQGRNLVKTVAALLAVALIGLAFALVPWDYRVEGEGRLMPVIQRNVFCPWDGKVEQIFVQSGQRVTAGDPLLQLVNDELRAEVVQARNDLNEKKKLLNAIEGQLSEAQETNSREEVIKFTGQLVETRIQVEGAEKKLQILEDRMERLTVRAPIGGVVATFQIEQLLGDRPVKRGESLLEIMDEKGPWRLQLQVEEHRMGHVLRAQDKLGTEELPVEFVLATHVEHAFNGTLDTIATRSNKAEEAGSVVEVFVDVNAEELPSRRIGAEVTAKINCGKRSLGYVLFGDVVEFVQKNFWL